MAGRILSFFLFVVFLSFSCAGMEHTPAEQAYLKQHGPVRVCVDPDWLPFERINAQGLHEGIAADLLKLAAERVGIQLELVKTKNWDESLQFSKDGRCDILSFLNDTPTRREWLIFTEPLFNDANVFITRQEHPYIADPAGLMGETIVFPRGTAMEERIRRDYPNLKILTVESEEDALRRVMEKRADMTMRSLIVAAYTIRTNGWFNLKIAGQLPNYNNQLRIGVAKSEPILLDILNKGVAAITPAERGEIVNRHIAVFVEKDPDYQLIGKIVLGFVIVMALALYWNYRLKRYNAELRRLSQTDSLTGLFNRMKIDELFQLEVDRAFRYRRPLSILMIDVDFFKRVNDDMGHQTGDEVLKSIADNLHKTLRTTDYAGRWGGEEFLILCPETTLPDAKRVGERLCEAVRTGKYASGRMHTISAGIAQFEPGESMDALLRRADDALYVAKHSGRDQICLNNEAPQK